MNASRVVVDMYIRGIGLISSEKNGYYLFNGHGDVVQLVNNSGTVTKTYQYDAFGVEVSKVDSDSNTFRYCGEYYDKETDTIYLRARYYNPKTGLFKTPDIFRCLYIVTPNGNIIDPLSLNLYTYCRNNPLLYNDPRGYNPGDKFETADEAAEDFANNYNESSINIGKEIGAAIVKVTVYGEKTVTKYFLWISWKETVADKDNIIEEYFTYTEVKIGTSDSVETTKVTKNNTNFLSVHKHYNVVAVAQIHTHGAYVNTPGERSENKFSQDDIQLMIRFNEKNKKTQDTYVVTQWGDMYKATWDTENGGFYGYSEPYKTGFYVDPKLR